MTAAPTEFWVSSGHLLLDHGDDGYLRPTEEFWRAYLARPEIVPPEDACLVEKAIHQRLFRDPNGPVPAEEIKLVADRDARENWRHFLAFRDHLAASDSIEAAYARLFRGHTKVTTPALFLNHMVHLILRNALDRESDAFRLRAAELMFRPQRLSIRDGVPLLADEELIGDSTSEAHASPLVAVFADARSKSLDVLTVENATGYHARSDAFDMVLDFRHGGPGRKGFARVMERFISHMMRVDVSIEPIERLEASDWRWFVGLDQEGTAIGNALWAGEEPPDQGRDRIVALFQLTFANPSEVVERVRGAPVYLILGMTTNRVVRVKPQNLLTGLPLATTAGPGLT